GAHDEAHLAGGHAGAQLVHHFLGNDVALLNVDLVHAGESATGKAGAGGTKYQDTKGTVQTIWHRVVTSTIESLLNGPESYPTDPRSEERRVGKECKSRSGQKTAYEIFT